MDIQDAILSRRTIRLFQQKNVPTDALRDLIDAARVTSCAANAQTLRFIVAQSPALVAQIFPCTAWAALVKPHRTPLPGVSSPTAFIAVIAPAQDKPINHADAGAAIQSMQLAATAHGLGCCWMGAIDRPKLAHILQLPDDKQVLYLLAIGFPAESPNSIDVSANDSVAYYLDDNNQLHVPKLRLEDVSDWR